VASLALSRFALSASHSPNQEWAAMGQRSWTDSEARAVPTSVVVVAAADSVNIVHETQTAWHMQ